MVAMRMILAIAAVLMALAAPAMAEPEGGGRDWSTVDYALDAACLASIVADYVQTKPIIRDGREGNPIMGLRGDRLPPEAYFATVATVHIVVTRTLPRRWRRVGKIAFLGVQAVAIGRNLEAGYGFRF
jgi:hypothetical protein